MVVSVPSRAATSRLAGLAVVAVLVLAAGRPAGADMETFTYNVPSTATPFTTTFSLDLFNTGLGTLTGVNITLNTNIVGEVDVYNLTGSPQTISNAFSSVPTSVVGPGQTTASATASANVSSATVGTGMTRITGLTATASDSVNVANANFGLYESTGPATLAQGLTASAGMGSYGGSGASGVFFGGSASASETITVTYTFTPFVPSVPAPASVILFGAGLIPALGTWRGRRKSAA